MTALLERPREQFSPKGMFEITISDKKTGKIRKQLKVPNGITNVGKDHALDSTFDAATQITSWYIGMVDNAGFVAFNATDTMGAHAGWSEFTAYSEGTRPEWAPDAAASQAITNGTVRAFTMSGAGTLKGLFIVSDSTKGGAGGTLWATAEFTSTIAVTASDLINITYTITT